MSGLQKRLLSALVLVPLVLGIIWLGGLPFYGLVLVMGGLVLREWLRLTHVWGGISWSRLAGLCYFCLAFLAFLALHHTHGSGFVMFFIGMVWLSDTGAYVMGRWLKGAKLAPKISPNKTWAGFIGALLWPVGLCVLVFLANPLFCDLFGQRSAFDLPTPIFFHTTPSDSLCRLPDWGLLKVSLLGLITGIMGQIGDLLISLAKRKAHVKDTGTLIPGHGGILDRIDSLLLCAIVAWIFLYLHAF